MPICTSFTVRFHRILHAHARMMTRRDRQAKGKAASTKRHDTRNTRRTKRVSRPPAACDRASFVSSSPAPPNAVGVYSLAPPSTRRRSFFSPGAPSTLSTCPSSIPPAQWAAIAHAHPHLCCMPCRSNTIAPLPSCTHLLFLAAHVDGVLRGLSQEFVEDLRCFLCV